MDNGGLSDLCTICHSNTPKYRCPGCKTHTCSLPCYTRHKQRASCNGKRDPTKYVKKSQWATPAGVDHDYNYLKTVERSIDGANEDAQVRGIGVSSTPSSRGAARAWQAGSGLQKYLGANRITVLRAPLGMSRQKSNRTRTTKRGNVFWTVEWVGGDGRRQLQHDCVGSMSIAELYRSVLTESKSAAKRQRRLNEGVDREARPTQKRRTGSVSSVPGDSESVAVQPSTASGQEDSTSIPNEEEQDLDVVQPNNIPIVDQPPTTDNTTEATNADETNATETIHTTPDNTPTAHFYLLLPNTPSKSQVLVPLDPNTPLTTSLQGRTVQEYPTIHVLPEPPTALPEGFQLEEEYLRTLPPQTAGDMEAQVSDTRKETGHELDAKSILDMLKRDVKI